MPIRSLGGRGWSGGGGAGYLGCCAVDVPAHPGGSPGTARGLARCAAHGGARAVAACVAVGADPPDLVVVDWHFRFLAATWGDACGAGGGDITVGYRIGV